jgi:hypothetical protein
VNHGLKCFHVHEELPFVVACTARKNGALGVDVGFADFGFEGVAVPELQRIRRLHIVVPIHADGGQCRIDHFLRVYHGISGSFYNFYGGGSRIAQMLGHNLSRLGYVPGIFWVCTHAREAKQGK